MLHGLLKMSTVYLFDVITLVFIVVMTRGREHKNVCNDWQFGWQLNALAICKQN
jgi:hypothetical protein